LRGVGPKLGAALRRRGFDTVRSLLTWTPTRYFDERSVTPLGALMEGAHVVVEGTVARIRSIGPRFRSRLEVTVESSLDAPPPHGTVRLVWFRAGQHIEKRLSVGARIVARGRVDLFRGEPNIVHPTLDRSGGDETALGVRPNYAPLEGIPAGTFAGIMRRAAELYADLAHDRLSPELRARHALPALGAALRAVHCPPDDLAGLPLDAWNRGTTPFHARIGFEHMFLFELCLRMRRAEDAGVRAHAIASAADPVPPRLPGFPFDLTSAQVRAAEAILTDLSGERPMRRLLQGDVGSGKTIVALLAARRVAESGHQAALLVPTEVLAEQHFRTFSRVLEGTGVGVELVVGGLRAAARRRAELRVASGEARIVIGTHALLNRGLPWKSLALAVIDEQ
ncbi:MAG: DEAD/DEAH box helicase, partial [Myxococcales bacterium]|nr:DEAD/DEAH box helicase [Myxococcales bacterium]